VLRTRNLDEDPEEDLEEDHPRRAARCATHTDEPLDCDAAWRTTSEELLDTAVRRGTEEMDSTGRLLIPIVVARVAVYRSCGRTWHVFIKFQFPIWK
jgi:hypothetical protein